MVSSSLDSNISIIAEIVYAVIYQISSIVERGL